MDAVSDGSPAAGSLRRAGDRLITGQGTPESAWQAWPGQRALAEVSLAALLPAQSRLVVVAPHPDDEVLACGGLLAMLAAQRGITADNCLLVAVTDGDASHPGSRRWPPAALARRRRAESAEGLRRLGLGSAVRAALGTPDGHVKAQAGQVMAQLRGLLHAGDTVLSPWRHDGHPDHDATAEATAAACLSAGCRHLEAPLWMWHWAHPADPRVPWTRLRRLALSAEARRAKAHAIAAHATQLETQDTGAPAVLPRWALDRWLRADEFVFLPGHGQ